MQTTLAQTLEESNGAGDMQDTSSRELEANPDNPEDTFDNDSISSKKTPAEKPREPLENIIIDDTLNNTNVVIDPENNQTNLLNCTTPYCELMKPENISGKIIPRLRSPCSSSFASPEVFAASDYSFVKQWGSKGNADGQFDYPFGIANSNSGEVIVADYLNKRIQKFTTDGVFITKWPQIPSGPGQNFYPHRVAVDGCDIIVEVRGNGPNFVHKFDLNLLPITQWASQPFGNPAHIRDPYGLALEASTGAVYVVDAQVVWSPNDPDHIFKFAKDGTFILNWGGVGLGNGKFNSPRDAAVDSSGNVFVVDWGFENVQKFTSNGNFLDKWGTHGIGSRQFNHPISIATDPADNVYVGDTDNKRIQKFSSDGTFITSIPVSDYVADISVDGSTGKVYATVGDHVEVYAPNMVSHKIPIAPIAPRFPEGLN